MVNNGVEGESGNFELASFGEVLGAFSALRCTSGRRRGGMGDADLFPWQNAAPNAADCVQAPPPRPVMAPAPRHADPPPAQRIAKPRKGAGRCQCGQCANCLENQRWERIFREKFASPDYYSHDLRIRYASPLSSF